MKSIVKKYVAIVSIHLLLLIALLSSAIRVVDASPQGITDLDRYEIQVYKASIVHKPGSPVLRTQIKLNSFFFNKNDIPPGSVTGTPKPPLYVISGTARKNGGEDYKLELAFLAFGSHFVNSMIGPGRQEIRLAKPFIINWDGVPPAGYIAVLLPAKDEDEETLASGRSKVLDFWRTLTPLTDPDQ